MAGLVLIWFCTQNVLKKLLGHTGVGVMLFSDSGYSKLST